MPSSSLATQKQTMHTPKVCKKAPGPLTMPVGPWPALTIDWQLNLPQYPDWLTETGSARCNLTTDPNEYQTAALEAAVGQPAATIRWNPQYGIAEVHLAIAHNEDEEWAIRQYNIPIPKDDSPPNLQFDINPIPTDPTSGTIHVVAA